RIVEARAQREFLTLKREALAKAARTALGAVDAAEHRDIQAYNKAHVEVEAEANRVLEAAQRNYFDVVARVSPLIMLAGETSAAFKFHGMRDGSWSFPGSRVLPQEWR